MTTLIVEDSPQRVEVFRKRYATRQPDEKLVFVQTADEAIQELSQHQFGTVWLDHDLGEFGNSGGYGCTPGTGMDVVEYIKIMPKDRVPLSVIIHSMNTPRAREMLERLAEIHIDCMLLPFSALISG